MVTPIPSQVQSMEEGRREPPIGLSCPTHQETSGANRGQVACILERKTSSCHEVNYTKLRFFVKQTNKKCYINLNIREL